jgi:hypothetical protein
MEQQRAAGVTERQVPEFIEDHQVGMHEAVVLRHTFQVFP